MFPYFFHHNEHKILNTSNTKCNKVEKQLDIQLKVKLNNFDRW
jgi:hypothetical protein